MKEPIPYERLLEIARKLHQWIFLHTCDDVELFRSLGLTDKENYLLGSLGTLFIYQTDNKE